MDFEAELKGLLARAEVAGVHALVIAHRLMAEATTAVKAEADVIRRHNPQLFGESDAKGG